MPDVGPQVGASVSALTRELDIIAHNLANASTAGYKRRCNAFTKALQEQTSAQDDTVVQEPSPMSLDLSQGNMVQTDRTLDFALYGKGFFVIETPTGPLYTRHGVFQTNVNGQIVDLSGRVVAGMSGPISLPANVDPLGLNVSSDGRISANGAAIGQFRVVEFGDRENQLVPAGDTCFRAPRDVVPADAMTPIVKQGYQEGSNVKVVDELVNLIAVSRLYEANLRAASVAKELSSSMISVAMG